MGVLFGLLMNWLASVFRILFLHAAFKIAITLAYIAVFMGAIYAYVQASYLVMNSISQTMPEVVSGVWGWVMPSNINTLFFVIFSVYLARFFTKQYLLLINARFRAAISN